MRKIVFAAAMLVGVSHAYANNWNDLPYTNLPQANPIQGVLDAARNMNSLQYQSQPMPTAHQCYSTPMGNGWTTSCY
jgi:hypothetical protein